MDVVPSVAWSPEVSLFRSLSIKGQRRELLKIADQVATPLLFLKGAWSEPVLHGGLGTRVLGDIDVLVHPQRASAFAQALRVRGFFRTGQAQRPMMADASKGWLYQHPHDGLPVDVHRGLVETPWFFLDPLLCFQRSIAYDSVDGPVQSLGVEDQIVFAAAHYASHGFDLDDRHAQDMALLLKRWDVHWPTVHCRAKESGLRIALVWLLDRVALYATLPVAALMGLRVQQQRRLRLAKGVAMHRWLQVAPIRQRRHLLILALLSEQPLVLPRFVVRYLRLRAIDQLQYRGTH